MIRVTLLIVILMNLTGCGSESKNAAVELNYHQSKPEAVSLSKTPAQYHVAESFNVGNNVVVRALASDSQSTNLWVGTTVGVLEVDLLTGNVKRTFTRENGLANEYVFAATADSNGSAWFGTNGGGVSRLIDQTWKTFFPMHGLGDYWVYSFADQKNTAMWIGTWDGLSRFDYKTKTFKTYVKELVNEWVYGLDLDSKGRLWVGTEGGVNMFDGETWLTWTHEHGLGAPNEQKLPFSENTGLGTRQRHDLSVLAEGRSTYNPNYVFCIEVAADDTVWAGTWGGGVSFYNGHRWQNITTKDGLAGDIVYSMAAQANGVIWFGTNNGLSRYDGKNWQSFTREDGMLDNHVYAVHVTNDGRIWAGTKHGVAVLEKSSVQ
ncbi:MAG: regulator [Gammaproteobacteria bacterium]|nr:regulator [Gammaproteobacteria bacterium]